MVTVVVLCETLQTIFSFHSQYTYSVTDFANIFAIDFIPWSGRAVYFTIIPVIVLCQSFYTERIWKLSKGNRPLTIMVAILIVCGLVFSFIAAIFVIIHPSWTQAEESHLMKVAVNGGFGTIAAADIAIAVILTYLLLCCRTGYIRTDDLIRKLMLYTVYTGSVTAATAIVAVVIYAVYPNSLAWVGIYFFLNRLYMNSLLGLLNNRESLRSAPTIHSSSELRNISGIRHRVPEIQSVSNDPTIRIFKEISEFKFDDANVKSHTDTNSSFNHTV